MEITVLKEKIKILWVPNIILGPDNSHGLIGLRKAVKVHHRPRTEIKISKRKR